MKKQCLINVHVRDVSAAVREVEKLLGKFGARKIEQQSLEDKEVLIAELKTQKLKEFMEQLKTIGETREKRITADIR